MFSSSKDLSKPLKIVLLGDGSTGKTSFYERISKYNSDDYRFNKKYKATTNFNLKKVLLSTNIGDINCYFWDTAGQEKYGGDLRNAYIQGADGALILYDVTNRDTIQNVQKWLDDINFVCNKSRNNIPIVVIGNKIDKIKTTSNLDHVKLRNARLKSMYKHSNISNYLISVKENSSLQEAGLLSSERIVDEGILNPIECLLTSILNTTVSITRTTNKKSNTANDNF
jgi:small GTP-binding protein